MCLLGSRFYIFKGSGDILSNMVYAGVRVVAETHIEETCAENITKLRSDRSRTRNRSSLSELFISFLAKVSSYS